MAYFLGSFMKIYNMCIMIWSMLVDIVGWQSIDSLWSVNNEIPRSLDFTFIWVGYSNNEQVIVYVKVTEYHHWLAGITPLFCVILTRKTTVSSYLGGKMADLTAICCQYKQKWSWNQFTICTSKNKLPGSLNVRAASDRHKCHN